MRKDLQYRFRFFIGALSLVTLMCATPDVYGGPPQSELQASREQRLDQLLPDFGRGWLGSTLFRQMDMESKVAPRLASQDRKSSEPRSFRVHYSDVVAQSENGNSRPGAYCNIHIRRDLNDSDSQIEVISCLCVVSLDSGETINKVGSFNIPFRAGQPAEAFVTDGRSMQGGQYFYVAVAVAKEAGENTFKLHDVRAGILNVPDRRPVAEGGESAVTLADEGYGRGD
jgi:hypothetical protein